MKRLQTADYLLLVALLPLWLGSVVLHVSEVRRTGLAAPPFYVTAGGTEDSHPRVAGFYVGRGGASGLVPGTRVIAIGPYDLRGVGHAGFEARARELGGRSTAVPLRFERNGQVHETAITLVPARVPWGRLPHLIVTGLMGLAVLLRAPSRREGRRVFAAALCFVLMTSEFAGGPLWQTYAYKAVHFVSGMIAPPLIVIWALNFPEELPPDRHMTGLWPWLFAVVYGVVRLGYYGVGPMPAEQASLGITMADGALGAAVLGAITWSYRRADALGRRRVRWALWGLYVGLMPVITVTILAALRLVDPYYGLLFGVSLVFTVLSPTSVFIAIVRENLYDIDRLIGATASYTLVGVVLLTGAFTLVPWLASAVSPVLGLGADAGQVLLSAALAALLVPANRRLRPRVDRFFFAERHAFQEGVDLLLLDLSHRGSPRELFETTGRRLDELCRPESCVIYNREDRAFTPAFVRGRAIPPAFGAGGSLVARLRERRVPLPLESAPGREALVRLDGLDRAALDALGAALAGPVWRDDVLASFLCLGRKRSGDVYTPTDHALLGAVCDQLGHELSRFDLEALLRDQREVYDAIRRYVPEAVAARVESGAGVEDGEREVSVLFVDLRGYTSYSEGRQSREIFSTVNQYTTAVSGVVRAHGGTIVEFNGDGMMAVFGAPEPLKDRERRAVAAARQIVSAVAALRIESGGGPLEVGIGVATGPAYVGSIQSADRMIWSAIGNTTNLAARLQALTRELDAAIVIDASTHARAGADAEPFERHAARRIRGRQDRQDLYVLPLATA